MDIESRLKRLEKENRKLRSENAELRKYVIENQNLKEENKRLKEELQELRLELFGLKKSKNVKKADEPKADHKPKKLGPPKSHKGTSRKRPERIDRTLVLSLESCPHCDVKRLANRALKYRNEMFTFILVPGVEPTNNPAERGLRPPVRQRKISGCHRTWEGATNRDVLMSVMGTMALQGEEFFEAGKDYVINSLTEET